MINNAISCHEVQSIVLSTNKMAIDQTAQAFFAVLFVGKVLFFMNRDGL